jgi:hypothetical protein
MDQNGKWKAGVFLPLFLVDWELGKSWAVWCKNLHNNLNVMKGM